MARWNVLATGAAVVLCAALVAGASSRPKPPAGAPAPEDAKPIAPQKTGYTNMPRVMREFQWAASRGKALEEQRKRLSANATDWREKYLQLQQDGLACLIPAQKERLSKELYTLVKKIEAEEPQVRAAFNEARVKLEAEIHENIRSAAAEMAKDRGLVAVIAHPAREIETATDDAWQSEVKLKPGAVVDSGGPRSEGGPNADRAHDVSICIVTGWGWHTVALMAPSVRTLGFVGDGASGPVAPSGGPLAHDGPLPLQQN